jgi:hypothetical protein
MPSSLQARVLHSSRTVTIADVRCRTEECACGPEELSTANEIIFPRTGVLAKKIC